MRKFRITLLLVLLAFASGCSLFGGDDTALPTGPTVNPLKLAKIVVPFTNNALQAVNAAPSRQLTADDVIVTFKNAATLANVALFGAVTFNANDITVTGEFKGIVVLVEIVSKATPTKIENVVLGEIADNATNDYATVTTTVATAITPATILATRNLIAEQAGATTADKIKALGAALDAANSLATASADSGVNTVAKEAALLVTAVATGALTATTANDNGDLEIIELLAGVKPDGSDLTTINTGVTAVETVYPTLTSAAPATIAKKDATVAAGLITITGTKFATDLTKLEVMLGTLSVPDGQLTVNTANADANTITFTLTAAQAAALPAGTALPVLVKQTITVNAADQLVTLTAPQQITITPAVLALSVSTVAKKDVPTTNFVISGDNFGTNAANVEVKIYDGTTLLGTKTGAGAGDDNITLGAVGADGNTITFKVTADQAAPHVGKTLTVKVNELFTPAVERTVGTLVITPAVLQSIAITPAIASIVKETQQQFVATGTYDDTTTAVITNDVTWAVSANGGTITNTAGAKGLYTAPNAQLDGVTVTATLGAIVSPNLTFNVITSPLTALRISDVSDNTNATAHKNAAGVKQLFTLQLYAYGDHVLNTLKTNQTTAATWSSATPGVATVGANTGIVTGVATGTATITATVGTITKTIDVTVDPLTGIAITADKATVKMNETATLVATGTYTTAGQVVLTDKFTTWTAVKGAVANAVFTPSEPGAATVTLPAIAGVNINTLAITVSTDPIITNFTVTRDSATQATITFTTVYAITGGVLQYSTKGNFGEGIDPLSMKIFQETAAAATTHSIVVTDITASTDDAGTTTSIEGWRFTVGYQIGADKYDSPLKSDGNVTIVTQ